MTWAYVGGAAVSVVGNYLLRDKSNPGSGSPPAQSADATAEAIAASKQSRAMGQDLFDYHVQNYRPLEQQAIGLASDAGSEERQAIAAGQAGATVQRSFTNAADARKRAMAGLGSKPDSGNAQDIERQNSIAEAGSEAGAMNIARQNERAYGLSAKTAVADVGRNITSNAIGADNAAANAAAVGIRGATATQDLNTAQNKNIGTAITDISGLFKSGSGKTLSPSGGGESSLGTDYGYAEGYDPTVPAVQNYGDYGTAYRKGGLVKPPRKEVRPSAMHGYVNGGAVEGPGTGTSDSIAVNIEGKPGAIAHGEYVLNAAATKKAGLKKLDRMNLAGLPAGSKMTDGRHVEDEAHFKKGGKVKAHGDDADEDDADDANDDEDQEYARGGAVMRKSLARPNKGVAANG